MSETGGHLNFQFELRKSRNPHYSLRAFAKKLEIGPGRMSEYLSGKRRVSKRMALKICDRLELSDSEREIFLTEVETKQSPTDDPGVVMQEDHFALIADWYHYAILSLIRTSDFDPSTKSIANRLGISIHICEAGLQRLSRIGMIKWTGDTWVRTTGNVASTTDVPSAALRMSHYQSISRSLDAIEDVPIELRDITSITMPVDPQSIPKAKKAIADFRKKISRILEQGNTTEVYELNVQLVPVTCRKNS